MKTAFIVAFFFLTGFCSQAQQMRYFQFNTQCGYNQWRDTSFIVATSDSAVIAQVLSDLTKPVFERRLIIGNIAHGNGGFNHNATYTFGWHFVPNQWHLQELAMEVCDGCPYSDIDLNPSYWIGHIGEFCPWTSFVSREVTSLVNREETQPEQPISLYPNPAGTAAEVSLQNPNGEVLQVTLLSLTGKPVYQTTQSGARFTLPLGQLPAGVYFLQVRQNTKTEILKFIHY